ncbi:molybdenum cofactor biosynthesis protein MoaE [Rathayibacter oskolensis]|uniref:molybdenum cofactor biosynthesis protein MoaE n=1 Tax=Rathayibacter oskolensis TaxID=1891671 RepID=UPI003465634E
MRIAAVHRVGDLVVGDLALACAVASAHRAAAFEACAALVDDIKASVPIWKEQSFVDGSSGGWRRSAERGRGNPLPSRPPAPQGRLDGHGFLDWRIRQGAPGRARGDRTG